MNYAVCLRQTDGSPVVRLGEGAANDLSRDGKWALANVPTTPAAARPVPDGRRRAPQARAGRPRQLRVGAVLPGRQEGPRLRPRGGEGRPVLRAGRRGRQAPPRDAGGHEPGVRLARRPPGPRQGERRRARSLSGRGRRGAARAGRDSRGPGHPVERGRPFAPRLRATGRSPRASSGSTSRRAGGSRCARSGPRTSPASCSVGPFAFSERPQELRVRLPAHVVSSLSRGGGSMTLTIRHTPRPVRDPLAARRRRDGRGLQGEGHAPRADGRAQGAAAKISSKSKESKRALRAGGAPARGAEPSRTSPISTHSRKSPAFRRIVPARHLLVMELIEGRRSRSGC